MKYESLLDVIGNTPLVRLDLGTAPKIYAKLEYLNPAGSIKDRSALFMIEEAERTGRLKPGGTIIEASSGNQGIATAMIGAIKGYRVIITVSEKVSQEKKATLKAYGAELVVCKPTPELDDPEGYYATAVRIQKETPNSFMLAQYFNQDNPRAHYYSTGPEIWNQTRGQFTHFMSGVGSCGTVGGISKYLKERNPAIKVIGIDMANSFLSTQGCPKPYKVEGLGVDFDAPHLHGAPIDEIIGVYDDDAIAMLKILAHKHGLLVGPASGAIIHGVYEYSKKLSANDTIITIITDSGRAYLTKNFYE